MPKQIVLNQITLCADGSIGLQWLKQIIDEGQVASTAPHRSVIEFDGIVEDQMAVVSEHLQSLGYPAISQDQIDLVKAVDGVGRANPSIEAERRAKISAKVEA